MTESEIYALLLQTKKQCEAHALVPRQCGGDARGIWQQLHSWKIETEPALLHAIGEITKGAPLPALTAAEATILWFRLQAAIDFLSATQLWVRWTTTGTATCTEPMPEHVQERQAWVWFLLEDMWDETGYDATLGKIEALAHGHIPKAHTLHDKN